MIRNCFIFLICISFFAIYCIAGSGGKEYDIQFQWEKIPGAVNYKIEVASNKEFKNIIMTKEISKNWIDWNSHGIDKLYWHVLAFDKSGHAGNYSDTISLVSSPNGFRESVDASLEENSVASPRNRGKFALDLYAFGTWGSMNDTQGFIPSRSMMTWAPGIGLGYRTGSFTPALYGEYDLSYQITPVANVSNQNISGQGYLAGLQLKYEFKKFSFAGSYLFLGQYQLAQSTTSGQTSTYSSPSAFSLIVGYSFSDRLSFLIVGKDVNYNNWNQSALSGDSISQIFYGMGLKYELF